ncbi:MAG: carboxypeptidase regulatory-like domain-containing protein [Bryobacteraceae bacterium]
MRRSSLLLCLFASGVLGQEFQGTILGRITDPSGAVVPEVAVTVTHTETGASSATKTNMQGNYRVPFLLPGVYRVLIAHPGFQKIERQNVRVSVATDTTLDIVLDVSTSSETVTVTATATALNTTNAELGQVVERAYIENVPVSLTRNVLNNISLDAVVDASGGTYTSNGQSGISIAGGGATSGNNEVIVDGVPNTIARSGGIIIYVPTAYSVDEMKVHTTMFDAAYGHSNGGAISITTKGGSNDLHGTLYDFKRWAALNANSWSNNRAGLRKPPVSYNQVGFMVSGPVRLPKLYDGRNRTFFSVAYERDDDKRDLFREARVPVDQERAGDFSQTLNSIGTGFVQIYDPWTTVGVGASATRTLFPGNKIPASRINPTGAAVAKTYAQPNQAVPLQINRYNWAGSGIYNTKQRNYTGRVDQILSPAQRLFVRYSHLVRIQDSQTLMSGVNSWPVSGNSDIGQDDRYMDNLGVDYTVTFSPTLVGSFRYGLTSRWQEKSNPRFLLDPSPLNLPAAIAQNQYYKAYPTFNLDSESFPRLGSTKGVNRFYTSTWLATFYKQMGNHSLKFGGDFRLPRYNNLDPGGSGPGTFTFNNTFTRSNYSQNASGNTSGSALASLLLGVPASGSIGYNAAVALQNTYTGLFVQEEWKIRRNLTLNFGVRYELETPYTERFDRDVYGFDYNAPSPLQVPGMNLKGGVLFAGVNGNPRTQGNADRNNFGPRFGFAWSLNSKTVVRGGFGMFYSSPTYNDDFAGAASTFNATTAYVQSIDSNATPYTTLANPFPAGIVTPRGSSVGLAEFYGGSFEFIDQNRLSPYNEQWQFGIQREAPGQVLIDASYMGMHSLKQVGSFNLNEKPDVYLALGAAENNTVKNPFLGIFNPQYTMGQGSTIPISRLWGLYPQYTSLTVHKNANQAIYHSGQLKVTKRYSHGLDLNLSYAFSKIITANTTSIINERPQFRGIDGSDRPHKLRLAFVYRLPLGRNRFIGGWTLSGYISYRSGAPLSVTGPNGRPIMLRNPTKSGATSQRLGDVRDPKTGAVLNPYFDTSAFQALPTQYTITPEPPYRSNFRGPSAWGRNMALAKDIRIWEKYKLQIRCEASNFTNSVTWGNPGVNMANQATFGVITSGGGGRSIQMSARVMF